MERAVKKKGEVQADKTAIAGIDFRIKKQYKRKSQNGNEEFKKGYKRRT